MAIPLRRYERRSTFLRNDASKATPLVRWLLMLTYIVGFILLNFPEAEFPSVALATLVPSALALWFGPISSIGAGNDRKLYDPATLFNLGMLYFTIKGISIAFGDRPRFLLLMSYRVIVEQYVLVAGYVTIGLIMWNLGYYLVLRSSAREDGTPPSNSGSGFRKKAPQIKSPALGIVFLILVGIASFFLLFQSIGEDPFVFLRSNWLRGYLADPTVGKGAAFGMLFLLGVTMLPTASLVWLSIVGYRGQKPNVFWWGYTVVAMVMTLLVSPRAAVLGFLISLLWVYHFSVKKVRPILLLILLSLGILYAYVVNSWRSITGGMQGFDFSIAISGVASQLNLNNLIEFISGSDLVDIRIFVLLVDNYGRVLPLKYGSTLLRTLYQLVPRAIWPNKPYDLGLEIGQLAGSSSLSGLPPGFFGEMYMNFHVLGVLVGGFVVGGVLAFLFQRWVGSGKPDLVGTILYAILMQRILLLPSNTFSNAVLAVLFPMAGALLAIKLSQISVTSKPTHSSANNHLSRSPGG